MREEETRALVLKTFRPVGRVLEEVWLRHLNGSDLRIDFLVDSELLGAQCGRLSLFGVEAKGKQEGMDENNDGLAQCIEYMHCSIVDTRWPHLAGRAMSSVVLFSPDTLSLLRGPRGLSQSPWYYTTRLAAKYGVGIVADSPYDGVSILMPVGHSLWSSGKGVPRSVTTWRPPALVGARIK